jgi:predicted permease
MRSQPGFAGVVIVTTALAIGATTAIFSVVNSVLIRPLPYPDPDRLVRIVHSIGGINQPYFSDAIYVTYLDNRQAFEDVGVWVPAGRATVTGRGEPEEVRALIASHGLLTTLGSAPAIGRWFSSEDVSPGAAATVMLAHGYWQRTFGGNADAVGRELTIDSRPYQIIGVMPAEFQFRGEQDVILPLRVNPGRLSGVFSLNGIARLKSGVTLEQANADVARMLEIYFDRFGTNRGRAQRWVPILRPLKEDVVGDVGTALWILMGAIGTVLLMACANIANLLLVRAEGRAQEFSIRAALGARWTRLARALLVESVMLALLGGLLGVAIAYSGLRFLVAMAPSSLPRLDEISIDHLSFVFAVVVSLLSGVLFGLIPMLRYARPQRAASVLGGGRGLTLTRERHRTQHALVALQMALALILLVSAGLMIRSFQALRNVDTGFTRPHEVQTFTFAIAPLDVPELERVARMQHEVVQAIAAIPGVSSVAFTTRLPMDMSDRSSSAMVAEDKPEHRAAPPNRHVRLVSPGMFQTLGTPLIAGRDFTWTDVFDRREIAIVSENLAREFWGSPAAALGKRVREFYDGRSPWREIVGVAGNVYDDGVHQAPPATVYWPAMTARTFGIDGYHPRRITVAIRTDRAATESLRGEITEAVRSVHANLPLAEVGTLGELYDRSMARTSFTLMMLVVAAAMASLLGVSGLYGVIAYAVSQRRREIGIRLALGARASEIRRLFVRRGLVLVCVGVAIGSGGAAAFTRLMQSLLFGVSPLDPLTFVAMPAALGATALLASYLSSHRVVTVDPAQILRAE